MMQNESIVNVVILLIVVLKPLCAAIALISSKGMKNSLLVRDVIGMTLKNLIVSFPLNIIKVRKVSEELCRQPLIGHGLKRI